MSFGMTACRNAATALAAAVNHEGVTLSVECLDPL